MIGWHSKREIGEAELFRGQGDAGNGPAGESAVLPGPGSEGDGSPFFIFTRAGRGGAAARDGEGIEGRPFAVVVNLDVEKGVVVVGNFYLLPLCFASFIKNCFQGGAATERTFFDGSEAVGYEDAGESRATGKCIFSDGNDAVGDGDAGESGAVAESLVSNRNNAIGNGINTSLAFRI